MNISSKAFFPNVWTPQGGEAELITTYSVVFLFLLFFWALLRQYWRASRWNKRISKGLDILNEAASESLVAHRKEIDDKMGEIDTLGEFWHEFDETLVQSRSGDRVYNTIDADHFFNTSTLGSGVTESRFIAAVPGMLTAIGVFGTFLGLMLGLRSLDMTNADTMQESIGMLIDGAAIAFTTSVWGIFFSLAFNITEKVIEGRLIKQIRKFQLKTDRLFDRNLGERTLLNIEEKTAESEKLLRVLGEQIGDKVQEGISSAIEPQLKKLAQTMEDLAERQASGAEEVMKALVGEFTDKMGEAGKAQSKAMEDAAQSLTQAMEELDATIGRFLNKVEVHIETLIEANQNSQETLGEFTEGASEFVSQSENTIKKYEEATKAFGEIVEGLHSAVGDLSGVHDQFRITVEGFAESQSSAAAAMTNSSESIITTVDSFTTAGEGMAGATEALQNATSNITKAIDDTSEALQALPQQSQKLIEEAFTRVKAQFEDYSVKITQQFEEFAESLRGSTEHRVTEWTENTQQFCNHMTNAVATLSGAIDELERQLNTIRES